MNYTQGCNKNSARYTVEDVCSDLVQQTHSEPQTVDVCRSARSLEVHFFLVILLFRHVREAQPSWTSDQSVSKPCAALEDRAEKKGTFRNFTLSRHSLACPCDS